MSDYPDPDEEYELMYADELEMLQEEDPHADANIVRPKSLPAKRSLNFSSPTSNIKASRNKDQVSLSQSVQPLPSSLEPICNTLEDIIPDSNHMQLNISSNKSSHTLSTIPCETAKDDSNALNRLNKRSVNDLFGDIGDIDFDDIQLPSKKQKTEEENDLDLISKILEGRKLRQILAEPSSKLPDSGPHYNAKDNLSLDIPRWAFMPLTNSDGDRIYVRLDSEDSWAKSLDMASDQVSLLSMYADTWAEARKLLEAKQEASIQPPAAPIAPVHDSLWVDKYRPKTYVELLSEEPVNRALLHWLHLWDKIVFKKEVKTKDPQQRTSFVKRAGQFQLTNTWKGKKEAEPEMDADGRPHHKLALLCGPPGVGKTTLAHLLARLAGYRPVELNASDERTTEAFRNALQSATLMQSVLDADRRPNCLILDEIDGAPLPTVELLVRWCTATAESGKKKSKSQPLRRPVIAICNDLYATSLRPLRAVSVIVNVGSVSLSRLTSRLGVVAQSEGLPAPARVCAALAARAAGDVRAAIQVLSFVKAARTQLTMEDVENVAIGTKDCNKTMMQALQAVFATNDKDPRAILKTIQSAGDYDRLVDGIFENYLTARVDSRLQIACETLSWLRFYEQVHSWTLRHQNYSLYGVLPLCVARCHTLLASRAQLRVRYPVHAQENEALSCFLFYEAVHSWTLRHQNYSLYGVLPLCVARCHTLLASRAQLRVRYPVHAQEMYRKKQELESITTSVLRGSTPRVASSKRALQLDVLPMLPHVLSVRLSSANVQLCSENQRKALTACAGAMCDYGLQYVQQRTQEGVYAFLMDPDIYKVAFYGNEEKHRPPPAVRQAIAREQQLETIRRNEEMANRVPARKTNKATSKISSKRKSTEVCSTNMISSSKDSNHTRLPNHLQRLKPKEVQKSTPQVHKDFFGRIVPLSQVQRTDAVPDVISSSNVFYQYREGFIKRRAKKCAV